MNALYQILRILFKKFSVRIGNDIDLVIDVGDLGAAKPSTVIDLSASKPTLVRNGFDSNDMDSLKEDLEKLI